MLLSCRRTEPQVPTTPLFVTGYSSRPLHPNNGAARIWMSQIGRTYYETYIRYEVQRSDLSRGYAEPNARFWLHMVPRAAHLKHVMYDTLGRFRGWRRGAFFCQRHC